MGGVPIAVLIVPQGDQMGRSQVRRGGGLGERLKVHSFIVHRFTPKRAKTWAMKFQEMKRAK